jgi:hypothetical protein
MLRDAIAAPLTLAWVLRDLNISDLATAAGIDDATAARLDGFRTWLIGRLIDPR